MKKRGLGRGLDALLSSVSGAMAPDAGDAVAELALERLRPGRHQPRRDFNAEALDSLAESIRAQGVVQPIVVRPVGGDQYEIVAGERRWRAAQTAGLATIPAVVRTLDDRAAMAVALVENIQRSDLNPLEQAEALKRLIEECHLTHDQCAQAVGRSRAAVTNLLRLFELNPDVQDLLREGRISLGHAKVLLGANGARQSSLAKLVAEKALSVRQTEQLLHARPPAPKKPLPRPMIKLERELTERIGAPVRIQHTRSGRGKLVIGFKDIGELERVVERLRYER